MRYEKYKDSGFDWIGEVPEHWEVKKMKYVVDINSETISEKTDKNYSLKYIDIGNVEYGLLKEKPKEFLFSNAPSRARRIVKSGDTLISTVRTYLKAILFIENADDNLIASTGFAVISPSDFFIPNFLFYILSNEVIIQNITANSVGVSYPAINASEIGSFYIWLPPFKEQTTIANYLDQKTSEIDELINQKEQLLELYEEEKTAIINQTVTKGINPDAQLKDCGIDYIGNVPEKWHLKKLRYLGNCSNGISKSGDSFGFGFPFVSYGDVYRNLVLPNYVDGLVNSSDTDKIIYSVIKGDVFFTRTSETIEEIGMISTCINTIEDAVFAGFLIRFRPFEDELFDGFSKYYFSAQIHRRFFVKEMNLVTRASLSQELLKRLPVALPSVQEQKEIAKYLDEYILRVDLKAEKTKKLIDLLGEYKQSLISEVVTGKIKVI